MVESTERNFLRDMQHYIREYKTEDAALYLENYSLTQREGTQSTFEDFRLDTAVILCYFLCPIKGMEEPAKDETVYSWATENEKALTQMFDGKTDTDLQ